MTVSQVARHVGLHISTIRRLDRLGVVKPERDRNGWRVYDESAVEALRKLYKRPIQDSR